MADNDRPKHLEDATQTTYPYVEVVKAGLPNVEAIKRNLPGGSKELAGEIYYIRYLEDATKDPVYYEIGANAQGTNPTLRRYDVRPAHFDEYVPRKKMDGRLQEGGNPVRDAYAAGWFGTGIVKQAFEAPDALFPEKEMAKLNEMDAYAAAKDYQHKYRPDLNRAENEVLVQSASQEEAKGFGRLLQGGRNVAKNVQEGVANVLPGMNKRSPSEKFLTNAISAGGWLTLGAVTTTYAGRLGKWADWMGNAIGFVAFGMAVIQGFSALHQGKKAAKEGMGADGALSVLLSSVNEGLKATVDTVRDVLPSGKGDGLKEVIQQEQVALDVTEGRGAAS